MATINEIEGMRKIAPLIPKDLFEQIILLDGSSTDGTVELAQSLGFEIFTQTKRGMINAYREVYPFIRGDYILTFSPDGNCDPKDLPALIEKTRSGNFDMVIVSRYLPPAVSYDDTFMSKIANRVFTFLINNLFGGKYTDAMTNFRAYKKSILPTLGLLSESPWTIERFFKDTISWEPLLSMRAAKHKLFMSELPGDEPPRIGGLVKCRKYYWGSLYLLEVIQEFILWKTPESKDIASKFSVDTHETSLKNKSPDSPPLKANRS